MPAEDQSPDNKLTQYRLSMIEQTLHAISDNLTKLAALEQKHIETRDALGRAFIAIDGHDERIRGMENEMPTLKLVRGWVISGCIGILGLLAVSVFKLFTVTLN